MSERWSLEIEGELCDDFGGAAMTLITGGSLMTVLPCNTPTTTTILSTSVTVQHNITFRKIRNREFVLPGNTEKITHG